MTNTPRGDIAITLDKQDYLIRPTFQALCEIEAATGKPILSLAEIMADGKITLTEMAAIIEAGIKAGSYVSVNKEVIGKEMLKMGITGVLAVISNFLHIALTGETAPTKKKPR